MSHPARKSCDRAISQGSMKLYLIGFILSFILTIIPFVMVMRHSFSHTFTLIIILGMAIMQVLVHLICFLHITTSSEEHWNLAALLFTVILINIIVVGSLWNMHHLNSNMLVS
ncbi:cytochrome o ubiquinol oxidase subunit IV [Candidatus Gillettellia adelgis]